MKSGTQGYFKTNKNSKHQRRPVASVLALLAALLFAGYTSLLSPKRPSTSKTVAVFGADPPPYWVWLEATTTSTLLTHDTNRPVYNYSVIPGGVSNSSELKLALARDPVAASHYQGFNARAAKLLRLQRARQVYVSYRLGNHIYWTSKKVTLRAGETLLTDGRHLVRGSCGNRISELPADPVLRSEPPEEVLDAPVLRQVTAEPVDLPAPPPIWTETPTPFLLTMASPGGPVSGGAPFIPPFPFVPCCSGNGGGGSLAPTPPPPAGPPPVFPPSGPGPGTSSNPPPNPPTPPPPVVPPVATPEPQTIELLVIGLATVFALSKLRRL